MAVATVVVWRKSQRLENHLCPGHQRSSDLLSGLFLSNFLIKFFTNFSLLHAKLVSSS